MRKVMFDVLVSVLLTIALIGILGGFVYALKYAFEKQEVIECNKLQKYAVSLKYFYLTEWQAEMCSRNNIKVNAPILLTSQAK